MLEPIGQATAAAQNIWGDATQWGVGTGVGTVSGGFEFPSVEEIDAVLSSWRARQASIAQRGNTLELMVSSLTQQPAEDDATTGYIATWAQSLTQLRDQHRSMLEYIEDYIKKLEAAKQAKQAGEAENEAAVQKTAGDLAQ
ncbi:hypothetical protein [Amycolatopsis sacchari]|uniref:hypothetical protein n=1 Tax=Amycolatopsis sacchari TaxID=115433 RepID=UPI003D7663ED